MKRNGFFIGLDIKDDTVMDDIHPFIGDPEKAKALLAEYLEKTPADEQDRDMFEKSLVEHGFTEVVGKELVDAFFALLDKDEVEDIRYTGADVVE